MNSHELSIIVVILIILLVIALFNKIKDKTTIKKLNEEINFHKEKRIYWKNTSENFSNIIDSRSATIESLESRLYQIKLMFDNPLALLVDNIPRHSFSIRKNGMNVARISSDENMMGKKVTKKGTLVFTIKCKGNTVFFSYDQLVCIFKSIKDKKDVNKLVTALEELRPIKVI